MAGGPRVSDGPVVGPARRPTAGAEDQELLQPLHRPLHRDAQECLNAAPCWHDPSTEEEVPLPHPSELEERRSSCSAHLRCYVLQFLFVFFVGLSAAAVATAHFSLQSFPLLVKQLNKMFPLSPNLAAHKEARSLAMLCSPQELQLKVVSQGENPPPSNFNLQWTGLHPARCCSRQTQRLLLLYFIQWTESEELLRSFEELLRSC